MFAYCLNNPVCRVEIGGYASDEVDLDCETKDDLFHQPIGGGNSSGDSWATFTNSMKAAASGLQMAFGEKVGSENHHFLSNKNKKYSPQYKDIANKYGLNLNDEWNTRMLNGHRGRHTNAYHEYMLSMLLIIDETANGDYNEFMYGLKLLFDYVMENPGLPYAH